jgi:toxin ParE1/3/4
MPQVVYSPDSIEDLGGMWDYVAQDSVLQADRLIARFRQKLEYLAHNNLLGRPRPELSANCRSVPIGKYCIYYRPSLNGIEVLRLIHSSRDIRQIKFPR